MLVHRQLYEYTISGGVKSALIGQATETTTYQEKVAPDPVLARSRGFLTAA